MPKPTSTDDLADMAHIVVVITPGGIELAEFDEGQMVAAHDFAMAQTSRACVNKVIVAARVRCLQTLANLVKVK